MTDYSLIFDNHLDLESKTIYVTGEITDDSATKFVKAFHILDRISAPINLWINSPGGDWDAGMAMISTIKNSRCSVTGVVHGVAASMASVVLQACDNRKMSSRAYLLLHDGSTGHEETHARNFERFAEKAKQDRELMYRLYAEKSDQPVSYWRRICQLDTYLSAEKSLELGLVDSLLKI